ncbi:MAG: ABC transporter ATP-binding protein [Verrucomicrobia bacterium]|nr:ABC transporter ATP-binding protein [Verrucomicrobiota bacterium]
MNIIETQNLTRRYGRTEAVHELNLAVPAGSVCALLGANGAGKTTTLKVLMNLLAPTAGAATVLGVDSRKLGERERAQIGYVSENQQMPLWMTVRQLLDYCRPFYPTWDAALEKTLLDRFALPAERKLGQLSRGMLMKAALLSSLAYRPKLLVLDEPFSGLDPLVRDEFIKGVLEVSEAGEWTVLVSSHDIEEVERLADRVALLEAGRLKFNETTEALQGRFRRIEVTLGESEAKLAAPPAGWLEVERAGRVVRFVDSGYERTATEQACRERFADAAVTAQPMSLRDIFISLARAGRRFDKLTAEATAKETVS